MGDAPQLRSHMDPPVPRLRSAVSYVSGSLTSGARRKLGLALATAPRPRVLRKLVAKNTLQVALLVNASVVRVLLRITVDRAPDPHGPVHAACTTLLSRAYDADAQDGVVRAMVDELLASAPRCLRHTFTCDPPAFSAAMAYDPEASAALRRALVRGRRDPASPLSRKRLACMSCPSSASVTTLIEPDANIQCGESISLFSQNSSNCLRLPAAPTTPRRTTPSPRVATGGQQRLDPEV